MVPIFISGFVYLEAANIVEKEINRTNMAMLRQVQQAIDSKMMDIQKISLQTALNPYTSSIVYMRNDGSSHYHYLAGKLNEELRLYKLSNEIIDNFYIYFKNIDYVLSHETGAESQLYYSTYINPSPEFHKEDFSNWQIFHDNTHIKEFVKVSAKSTDGRNIKSIAYVQSIPMSDRRSPLGSIVIQLDEAKLIEAIENVKLDPRAEVFILDKSNTLIASTQPGDISYSINFEALPDIRDVLYRTLNGENMAISYLNSEFSDMNWKYVTVIPARIFAEKAEHIRKLVLISVLLCFLIGGFAAYFFTKRNYHPVKDIMKGIASKAGIPAGTRCNEYNYIREAISNTINEKEAFREKLKRHDSVIKSNFLTKLLLGRLEQTLPVNEALASFDIAFMSEYFAVILFCIEDYNDLFKDEDKLASEERLTLVQFIIANVVEELANQKSKGLMVEISDTMACLLNFGENELEEANAEIIRIVDGAMAVFRDSFKIHLTVSISNVHDTFAGIPKAYQEALDAMEYKMLVGSEEVIKYENVKKSNNKTHNYYYNLEIEQQLINTIKMGDFIRSRDLLNEIFDKSLYAGSVSLDMAKCLMFDLVSTFVKTLEELEITSKGIFLEEFNPVEELFGCKTIKEMKLKMISILSRVCNYIETRKKSHNSVLKDQILLYIEDHYDDDSLSIAAMANLYNVNLSYLSKFFKEQTGEGLLDYVNRFRLEKAKGLLQDEDANIGEVARKVGFYNSNALIRVFKKYEGITPGQYKSMKCIS